MKNEGHDEMAGRRITDEIVSFYADENPDCDDAKAALREMPDNEYRNLRNKKSRVRVPDTIPPDIAEIVRTCAKGIEHIRSIKPRARALAKKYNLR